MRHRWTNEQIELLRREYRRTPAAAIAAMLGVEKRHVYSAAGRYGLRQKLVAATDQQIEETIAAHHAEGWTDAEISRHLQSELGCGVCRHRIGVVRARMGLPENSRSALQRQRVRLNTIKQLEAAGFNSLAELRISRFNQWKRSMGWPEHLTVRAVQAAELLRRHGPMTRLQLCAAMGIREPTKTCPKSNAKGGTVLAELMRAGIVSRLVKVVANRQSGRGSNKNLYFLEPEFCREHAST